MPRQQNPPANDVTCAICDGLFTVALPSGWRFESEDYTGGSIELRDGHRLRWHAQSLDAPEAIADGKLIELIQEPGLEIPPLEDAEVAGNIFMFVKRATADRPPEMAWKTIDVLDGRYIRSVRFSWLLGSAGGDAETRGRVAAEVSAFVGRGRFAEIPTPLDRVAPTSALKRISPWGLIHLRVPNFWQCEHAEDGRFVCDVAPADAPPDPTLWLDCHQVSVPDSQGDLSRQVRELAKDTAGTLGSPDQVRLDLDDRGAWIESVNEGEEGGTALMYYNLHRFVADAPHIIIAHFNLVLPASDAGSAAGRTLIDLMHREIRAAIVLARPPLQSTG